MADAAKIKTRAISDIMLILIGPMDETVVTVFGFHGFEIYSGDWD
jgi:hypothetical protein